ncbi:MAG TPA: anaerobic sulfatase maturase [Methanothrix sp.]|nr:anaerobic sulfatase maturase [Methanothrix sp.]HPJ83866.1 anaerobic sulfatase maturase [Methanothrix sp.]
MSKKDALPGFHLMAKPTGAACNLGCKYCFFLSKKNLYPKSSFRMSDELLETYIRQYVESQRSPSVTIAWQGGEPTLMGLDFFRRSIELEEKYRRPGMTFQNTMQTNGTLLDDEWCEFFRETNFLIGLSLDGPRELHDAYRVDKLGGPTFDRVMKAARLLKKHEVDFNILTTVHAANQDHPLEVYRFLRDEVKTDFIQFIPIVERDNDTGYQEGDTVTDRSVDPEKYGRFLISVFDEWVKRDVGKTFVQIFDVALAAWSGVPAGICAFSETCGTAMVMEHNGDVYSCDHFVEPKYLLGNINERPLSKIASSAKQRKFGRDKLDLLPEYCRKCEVRFVCNGECPKNRFIKTPDGEPGLNYLCSGYKEFFRHIDGSMRFMADELRRGRAPANIMSYTGSCEGKVIKAFAKPGRNDPCPCGSGLKFKKCHGRIEGQRDAIPAEESLSKKIGDRWKSVSKRFS